jgi:hypothetical protein
MSLYGRNLRQPKSIQRMENKTKQQMMISQNSIRLYWKERELNNSASLDLCLARTGRKKKYMQGTNSQWFSVAIGKEGRRRKKIIC